jgi:anaerobic ribonucleoside-triphosphate reductase activating protein
MNESVIFMKPGTPLQLNLAASVRQTRALGPGLRAAVWVQGCPLCCAGCISPAWSAARPGRLVNPTHLAAELLGNNPRIEGLTLSGGEPFAQAAGLAAFVFAAKSMRAELNVLCFSGYRLETLGEMPAAQALLAEVDTLIDSPYVSSLNDGHGLRGSSNQRVLHLTDRMSAYDFDHAPRQAEMYLQDHELFLVGVPPRGLLAALDAVAEVQA